MMAASGRTGKVLIIDDDEETGRLFAEALEPSGCRVVILTDPDEAIEEAIRFVPDVVFVSLVFKNSNGLKVSKAIHSSGDLKNVPIVLLGSRQGEIDPKYMSSIGIVDIVIKPLKKDDIVAKTSALLGTLPGESPFGGDSAPASIEEDDGPDHPGANSEDHKHPALQATDEGLPDFDFNFDEETSSKRESSKKPAQAARSKDETEAFLSSDESDDEMGSSVRTDTTMEDPLMSAEEPRPGRTKKFAIVAIIVLAIAGAVASGFLLKDMFFKGGEKKAAPVAMKETPVHPAEKKTESAPTDAAISTTAPPADKQTATAKPAGPAAKESSEPKQPTTVAKSEDKPAVKPSTSAAKRAARPVYSVQIGVFENEKNATSLQDNMKQKGYDAFIEKDDVKSASGVKHINRVLIGKFDSRNKALEQSKMILDKEKIKAVVYEGKSG